MAKKSAVGQKIKASYVALSLDNGKSTLSAARKEAKEMLADGFDTKVGIFKLIEAYGVQETPVVELFVEE